MGTSNQRRWRRLGIAALLVGLAMPVVAADPVAAAPDAPTDVTARGTAAQIDLRWTAPPTTPDDPILRYEICPSPDPTFPAESMVCFEVGSEPAWMIGGLAPGVTYYFRVRARSSSGVSPWSATSAGVAPMEMWAPFPSWDANVRQQLLDFTGDPGTPASRAPLVEKLARSKALPKDVIRGLLPSPWLARSVAPVIRLYSATFERIPDHGGLEYWAAKRRTGTTLARIASTFAASSEFRRRYGTLSDAAFVDLVYQHVLLRPSDPDGRAFWVRKLRSGMSRGQVVLMFSESNENVVTQARRVEIIELYHVMLDRSPTAAELGGATVELINQIRLSAEYADRVT